MKTRAAKRLDLRREEASTDYPFSLSWRDDPEWWRALPEPMQNMDLDVMKQRIEQVLNREKEPVQFIASVAHSLGTSRFDRVDFKFLAGDIPEAVTFYDDKDDRHLRIMSH